MQAPSEPGAKCLLSRKSGLLYLARCDGLRFQELFFVVAKLAILISIEKRYKPVCTKSSYWSAGFFLFPEDSSHNVQGFSSFSWMYLCFWLKLPQLQLYLCSVPRKFKCCQYSRNTDEDIAIICFTMVLTSYPLNVWLSAELICIELTTACGSWRYQTHISQNTVRKAFASWARSVWNQV